MDRRQFFFGVGAAVAAPAVIRIAEIMPIKFPVDFTTDNLLVTASERFSFGYIDTRALRQLVYGTSNAALIESFQQGQNASLASMVDNMETES
jgi:hypothetical protein